MNETITLSREQLESAAATIAILADVRRNPQLLMTPGASGSMGLGAGLAFSHTARRSKCFMHPDAAVLLGKEGRKHVGGLAHRHFDGFMKAFAQPTATDVHVDAIMTNISIAYRNKAYIGAMAVPRVQVVHRSDKFFTFDTANLRNDALERAPGTPARRGGYGVSTASYAVINYSIEHAVPDEVRRNTDNPLNPDRNGTNYVSDVLDLKYEKQAATLINTTGNWTTNATLTGTGQWSDFSNSDPVSDIWTAIRTVLLQTGTMPNTMVLGFQVFEKLSQHPDLLDRVKYTGTGERPAMVTAQMIAELFGLEQVLVGSAIENTANEGQTDVLAFVWAKHAWVGYIPSAPALESPAACYGFTNGRLVDVYRDNASKSDIIRADEAWDLKKTAAGAGYRIINAVG